MTKFLGLALIWFGITCMLAGLVMVFITFLSAVSTVHWDPYFIAVFATCGVISAIILTTADTKVTINDTEL
jgi:hypothetical protein